MKSSAAISALLFLVGCHWSQGSTFYVSNDGNNGWNGSQSSPWETLQYAADHVSNGDTVITLPGEYTGFYLERSGEPALPIVFIAQPGAVIDTRNATTPDGINLEGADYTVIDGFTITNDGSITRAGIRSVVNTGVVLRNNHIDGMGTWGIFTGFSESILIEGNYCARSQEEHGIYHSNSADNAVIRKNTCEGNSGCGIHINADASMGGDGVISNILVEQNILFENGNDGGSAINCDGVQNSVIRNNLLYDNHAGGISLYRIDGGEPARNNLVINNTIDMAADGRWCINIQDESTGNTVYNNILFTKHSYRGAISISETSLEDFTSDYNVMLSRFTLDDGNSVLDIDAWRQQTAQDVHSYISTPEEIFNNPPTADYHLTAGCIAIDKGTPEFAPTRDLEGNVRPAGEGVDIGCYEYGGLATKLHGTSAEPIRISVFPNPAGQQFTIQSDTPITGISLIDQQGRVVREIRFETGVREISVRRQDLSGYYFARIVSKEEVLMIPVCFSP